MVEDIEQPDYSHLPPEVPTDVRAIGENFITITPLQYNLTDVQGFQHLHRNSWLDWGASHDILIQSLAFESLCPLNLIFKKTNSKKRMS